MSRLIKGCTRFRLMLQNPSMFCKSGQICSRIWWMLAQQQYVQLITDKTNAAELLSGVFTILISGTRTIKVRNSLPFHKFCQTGKHVT